MVSVIIWAAVTIIIIIAVVIAVVLLTPISLRLQGRLADKADYRGEIAWAGGLTSVSLRAAESNSVFSWRLGFWEKELPKKDAAGKEEKAKEKAEKAAKKKAKEEAKEKGGEAKNKSRFALSDLTLFLSRQLLKEVIIFLGRIFRSFNLRLSVEGEYGADDPALTGYLSAMIGYINSSRYRLRLNPNFQEPVLDLRGEMCARLVPAVLIFQVLRSFFAPAVRKIWRNMLKQKFKRRA